MHSVLDTAFWLLRELQFGVVVVGLHHLELFFDLTLEFAIILDQFIH